MSTSKPSLNIPTHSDLQYTLGIQSSVYHELMPRLDSLFALVKDLPEVAATFRQWQYFAALVYGSDAANERLFIRHTYLALIARFVARLFLAPASPDWEWSELGEIVLGGYFQERAVENFIDDDFFTWLFKDRQIAESAQDLLTTLAQALSAYDFSQAESNVLQGLYDDLIDADSPLEAQITSTPGWLAEYLLDQQLGLSDSPDRRVLDPCCGSGTYLYQAIALIAQARTDRGEDPFEILINLLDQVMGLEVNPVAVTVARVSYLMALDDLVKEAHPPILIPVYLADHAQLAPVVSEAANVAGESVRSYWFSTVAGLPAFPIPQAVAANLEMLDWLFVRFPNYLRGAALRRLAQSEDEAIQEVLNAFHNYLASPKPKTPIPDPLDSASCVAMEDTAARLLRLYLSGQGQIYRYILKNLPASVYMTERKFDLVVGSPHQLMPFAVGPDAGSALPDGSEGDLEYSPKFLARDYPAYLKDDGQLGMWLGWTVPDSAPFENQPSNSADSRAKTPPGRLKVDRLIDLSAVSSLSPLRTLVIIASKGQETTFPIHGVRVDGDAPATGDSRGDSWSAASKTLIRKPVTFILRQGRLQAEE